LQSYALRQKTSTPTCLAHYSEWLDFGKGDISKSAAPYTTPEDYPNK
jgi:hypothetical protein